MAQLSGKSGPEKKFQNHIVKFFQEVHQYIPLEASDITDPDWYFVEDHLISFIRATQKETWAKLAENYGSDSGSEIFRALKKELESVPLWLIVRKGLVVRGFTFNLFYPVPRSRQSEAARFFNENRISFKEELVIKKGKRPDLVLFLNGLPVITVELKHEKNQTVHDAVVQYVKRDHKDRIFQLPFLHIAADTSDVMVATDPSGESHFRWHNSGLKNKPLTPGEYPVEFLYRQVLSTQSILNALSFYLIYVPFRDAEANRPEQEAFTIFPRFHQSRMVENLAFDLEAHFLEQRELGRKYLVHHSAGSGKTLSICWLADRLHSLFRPGTNEKIVQLIFILTDRKALDKNIKEDMEKLVHLKDVVGIAKKAEDLRKFIQRGSVKIIVSTQQKFKYILDRIQSDDALKKLRVAFLIDEAHRSQEGKTAKAVKLPFREPDIEDAEPEGEDPQEEMAKIIRAHDKNQIFVAFTATPARATLTLFGEPFDEYTEDEAIQEGYILDVATGIISYKTLYNLYCPVKSDPEKENLYPAGVVAKALKNVAFQDDGLIQYKAEIMLRIFEETVIHLIEGRAKAMIVTSSRLSGLRYFNILKEKLKERESNYKVLYAFSSFIDPDNTVVTETGINELKPGEAIEDRFKRDDYRLMVVANKFQEGFDQPLLAGMFLDKAVIDRNAVQTLSRLNRCHDGKDEVVVVDFTNNARKILKAFQKYRKGTPFSPEEPDSKTCLDLYDTILAKDVFDQTDADHLTGLAEQGVDADVQARVAEFRDQFQERLPDVEDRKSFVYLLSKFVKVYYFLSGFFTYPSPIVSFVIFAEIVEPQLIKKGSDSDLMKQIRKTKVIKASVKYVDTVKSGGPVKLSGKGRTGAALPVKRVSIDDAIERIRQQFTIPDDEAIIIREVTEEKMQDKEILNTIHIHREDEFFIRGAYKKSIDQMIRDAYGNRGRYDEMWNPIYTDEGAIFDIMSFTVIEHGLQRSMQV